MNTLKIDNNTNFQAIRLTSQEARKANDLIRGYRFNVENNKKIFDFFEKHIKAEAAEKAGFPYCKENIALSMFMKLYELVYTLKGTDRATEKIVRNLNKYEPGKNDLTPATDILSSIQANSKSIDCPNANEELAALDFKSIKPLISETIHKINLSNGNLPFSLREKSIKIEQDHGIVFDRKALCEALKKDEKIVKYSKAFYESNIKFVSDKLGISGEEYKEVIGKQPELLGRIGFEVYLGMKEAAKRSGETVEEYAKKSLKTPSNFLIKPQNTNI